MADIKASVMNGSTVLTDEQVGAIVPALRTQVHRDFAPVWGVDADLTFIPGGATPPAGTWWLGIFDDSDQAGALGYHDVTSEGLPLGKVFAGSDIQAGLSWTVTASHELLEMLADPEINLSVMVDNGDGANTLYAYEVCDACEADMFGYRVENVLVSDFVYPAWFESFQKTGSAQFDQTRHVTQPFHLLPGGYIGVYNIQQGSGWTQLTAREGALTYRMRPPVGSRRERRRTPRRHWMTSTPARAAAKASAKAAKRSPSV